MVTARRAGNAAKPPGEPRAPCATIAWVLQAVFCGTPATAGRGLRSNVRSLLGACTPAGCARRRGCCRAGRPPSSVRSQSTHRVWRQGTRPGGIRGRAPRSPEGSRGLATPRGRRGGRVSARTRSRGGCGTRSSTARVPSLPLAVGGARRRGFCRGKGWWSLGGSHEMRRIMGAPPRGLWLLRGPARASATPSRSHASLCPGGAASRV